MNRDDLDPTANPDTSANRELVRTALTLDDQLDDIKRAQIWSRLDRAIDVVPARRVPWRAFAAIAASAAAVVVWFALRPVAGSQTFVAPADSTLTAQVGPHTRAELIGPARLDVVGAPGDATRVRLRQGALVAEFSGGPGRSLHIEAPGASIDIVGTLFAVEVVGDGTCVSVAHGKVAVTAGAQKLAVATGESWCSARPHVEALSPASRGRFDRFTALQVATAEPAPQVVVTPIAPVEPAPRVVITPITPAEPPKAVEPAKAIEPAKAVEPAKAIEPAKAVEPPKVAEAPKRIEPSKKFELAKTIEIPTTVETSPVVAPAEIEAHAIEQPASEPQPVVQQPAPTPVVVKPPPPPPVTAESLYQSAEAALAKRDLGAADRALATLTTTFGASPLVDQATYERARIAYERHAWSDARRHLETLAQNHASPLAEPGAYLACRIDVETHDESAARCLTDYRKAYPSSPHDLDVLGLLVDLSYRAGGCARAASGIDELGRRYPRAQLARAWRARCEDR